MSSSASVERVRNQFLATIIINVASFGYGLGLGWASPNVPLLLSADSPLSAGPVSPDQATWISSLFCVGGACGVLLISRLLNWLGRKWSLTLIGVPQIASWALIVFTRSAHAMLAARFLIGLSGGAVMVAVPVFVTEISVPRVRGVLGFVFGVCVCTGTLVTFVLAHCFAYAVQPSVALTLAVLFMAGAWFLPETPRHLLGAGRSEAAERALAFYWQLDRERPDEAKRLGGELARLQAEVEERRRQCGGDASAPVEGLRLADFRVPATRRGIAIASVLVAMTQFCGSFPIINYTAEIFAAAGSRWHPNVCAMVIAALQVAAAVVFISLIDRVGRKVLMLVSGVLASVSLGALGGYFWAQARGWDVSEWGWLPLASMSSMMFVVLGVSTLPYVLVVELLPPHLRSSVTSYFMLMQWLLGFAFVKYFNLLLAAIDMHGCMWLFGGCCAAEAVFIAAWMPETKGRTWEEIRKAML